MTQKPLTYIVLVLLIGGGFLVGSFFGGSLVGGLVAPSDHKAIVADFKIYDNYYGYLPSPFLVTSGTLKLGEKLATVSNFIWENPYQFSCWAYARKGDVEFTIEIWGPDESGHTYYVGFGKLGLANGGYIEYQGATVLNIQNNFALTPNGEGTSGEGIYTLTITR